MYGMTESTDHYPQPVPKRRTALDHMRDARREHITAGRQTFRSVQDATQPQLDFIEKLLHTRVHPYASDVLADNLAVWTNGLPLTKEQASRTIEFLKAQPFRNTTPPNVAEEYVDYNRLIREHGLFARGRIGGRFGVDSEDPIPHTVFWVIKERTARESGKKYFALFQRIGGQGDVYYKGSAAAKLAIVRKIVADVREATLRWGELGECGVCGAELTDPESRAARIGPVCASKRGW